MWVVFAARCLQHDIVALPPQQQCKQDVRNNKMLFLSMTCLMLRHQGHLNGATRRTRAHLFGNPFCLQTDLLRAFLHHPTPPLLRETTKKLGGKRTDGIKHVKFRVERVKLTVKNMLKLDFDLEDWQAHLIHKVLEGYDSICIAGNGLWEEHYI